MPIFNPNEPQNGEKVDADVLRDQFNCLNDKIDAVPAGPPGPQGPAGPQGPQGEPGGVNPELDPVFAASEAAQFVPGDKAKLDSALQPGGNVSALGNDAGYLISPMSGTVVGDMIYNIWSDTAPGATMKARLAIGTPGQILAAMPSWQNGTGVFPAWVDNTALQPNPTANGTYPIANDGVTSGQLTGITITNGLITGVTTIP